jgi:chromosome segregation ATPase
MDIEPPQTMMLIVGGAFLLGYVVAKIGGALGRRFKATHRDPRDDRIRSLDAELRIARGEAEKLTAALEALEKEVAKAQNLIEEKDQESLKKTGVIEKLNVDLRESVKKTRELRHELADRATENVKSEVKLREVETELEVAQASSEMINTGVLDYDTAPQKEDTGKRRRKEDKMERSSDYYKSGT